mgnify:CR=1 FL=1
MKVFTHFVLLPPPAPLLILDFLQVLPSLVIGVLAPQQRRRHTQPMRTGRGQFCRQYPDLRHWFHHGCPST